MNDYYIIQFYSKEHYQDKNGHFITIKESFIKRYTVILNVYSPTNSASKYIKQNVIELQGEIKKLTITVKDFNTILTIIDRTSKTAI